MENLGLLSARTRGEPPLGAGGASESVLLVSRATRRRAGARGPWFEVISWRRRYLAIFPSGPGYLCTSFEGAASFLSIERPCRASLAPPSGGAASLAGSSLLMRHQHKAQGAASSVEL